MAIDLVEEILLRLPLKSILEFKTVSREWRSILESRRFAERRMSLAKKKLKILAVVGKQRPKSPPRFKGGDAEIEMVYLQCGDDKPTSLTCNGLVCLPTMVDYIAWMFGHGIRMVFDRNYFRILDVNTGEWRKLGPPPYKIHPTRKSACVNSCIYWLDFYGQRDSKILALDLHTEEFRDVPLPAPYRPYSLTARIVNLEDRLAIADTCTRDAEWRLEIWIMADSYETTSWSMTYCIVLPDTLVSLGELQGCLYFYESDKRLFKYDPNTALLSCLSPDIYGVLSPLVENL
ncbi:hypothetical protein EUTSA_v10005447mg, partial [Eutrema salsugineum]